MVSGWEREGVSIRENVEDGRFVSQHGMVNSVMCKKDELNLWQ